MLANVAAAARAGGVARTAVAGSGRQLGSTVVQQVLACPGNVARAAPAPYTNSAAFPSVRLDEESGKPAAPLECGDLDHAVSLVKSGDNVFLHSAAATPQVLVDALTARASSLRDVTMVSIHTEGDAPYLADEYKENFKGLCMFVGANTRHAIATGRAAYLPVFLNNVPGLFRSGHIPLDVALVQVSPPDAHGYCSLGVSCAIAPAAVASAKTVIAQVNRFMPRTHGDGIIHASHLDAMVECDHPLVQVAPDAFNANQKRIGRHCAGIIPDGATLQMGIGAIPNAVLHALRGHRHLGIHTEMFSDGVKELVDLGVVTGKHKEVYRGMVVAGFAVGTDVTYDFVDDNPFVKMLDIEYVNNPYRIARNPKVAAINSALEIDITGQVCADSIGPRIYSGVGGQVDFMKGAAMSEGGVPIIAMESTTSKGKSKIVSMLTRGAGVVTTRADVHWVVTEYGAVNLNGKDLISRGRALASIAHPDHREELDKHIFERYGSDHFFFNHK